MAEQRASTKSLLWLDALRQDQMLLRGLRRAASLDLTQVETLFQKIARPDDALDISEALSNAKALGISVDELTESMSAVTFFFGELPNELTIREGVRQMAQVGVVANEKSENFANQLEAIDRHVLARASARNLKASSIIDGLLNTAVPKLEGLWTRCISVARFAPVDDKEGNEEQPPTVSETIPIAILQLDVSTYGTTQRFAVGLTGEELARFISKLRKTQSQLVALQSLGVKS